MARATTKAQVNITNKFLQEVGESLVRDILPKMIANIDKFYQIVYDITTEELNKNPIYSAIAFNSDQNSERPLRAEFGLTEQLAKSAAKEIKNILLSSITVQSPKVNKRYLTNEIVIKILFPDPETLEDELVDIPSGTYISENKSGASEIPWMQWLIDRSAGPIDKLGKEWYISYDLSKKGRRYSRSGKAVMVSYRKLGKVFGPYTLPGKFISPGDNFLSKMFNNKRYIGKLQRAIEAEIRTIAFNL